VGGPRRGVISAVAAVVVVAGGSLAGLALRGGGGEAPNGAGFNYRDQFYGMSGAEIRPGRLGPVLDRDIPIMDTSTDVREVLGIDPATAVAAYLHDVGGTAAENGGAWLLMSPDQELAADPWGHPGVSDALNDPR
jgi:hypothetical protein